MKTTVKGMVFRLGAVTFSLIFALGALELIFYLIYHDREPHGASVPNMPIYKETSHGRRLRPNLDYGGAWILQNRLGPVHLESYVRTNSRGLRGREIAPEKAPGFFRVMFLGDSVTLADYLPEGDTFSYLVGNILSERHSVETINAGIGDVGINEEIWVMRENLDLKPDLVILGFYLNDSRPPWGFEKEVYRLPRRLIEVSKILENHSYFYQWVWRRFLVTHYLRSEEGKEDRFQWIQDWQTLDWKTSRPGFDRMIANARFDWGAAWRDEEWKEIYAGMDELRELLAKNQIRFGMIIFPVSMQVEADFWDDRPQRKMLAYCQAQKIPCLDLLPILRARRTEELYFDQCHFAAPGQQLISGPIADFIEANFMKNPGNGPQGF